MSELCVVVEYILVHKAKPGYVNGLLECTRFLIFFVLLSSF